MNWMPNTIVGSAPDYFDIRDWDVTEGRIFTPREVDTRARVCVVGTKIVQELFGGNSPIDSEIRIKNVTFTVIGVLQAKGANMMGFDEDDIIIAPWTTVRLRVTGLKTGRRPIRRARRLPLPVPFIRRKGSRSIRSRRKIWRPIRFIRRSLHRSIRSC